MTTVFGSHSCHPELDSGSRFGFEFKALKPPCGLDSLIAFWQ